MATTRLEVRLSEQVNQRLEALAAAEGLTKPDVFRQEAGARLQFAHGDQVETLVNI